MTCAPQLVTAYVDDELGPVACRAMSLHLERCGRCSTQAAAERCVRARLRRLVDPPLPRDMARPRPS